MKKVMDIDRYNTKVRQAISDEYVKCSKKRSELQKEESNIYRQLIDEKDSLSYSEYMKLKEHMEYLQNAINALSIKLDTWDKAREICLNIANEM